MIDIKEYIFEKFRINKDTDLRDKESDPTDDSNWSKGDIIVAHGFRIEFYKIESRTASQFKLLELGTKLVDGYYNSATYKAVPHGHPKDQKIVKGIKTKNGFSIDKYKYNYVHLWDGNPVEGHGNM